MTSRVGGDLGGVRTRRRLPPGVIVLVILALACLVVVGASGHAVVSGVPFNDM